MNVFSWKSTLSSGGSHIAGLPGKIRNMFCGTQLDSTLNKVLFYGAEDEEQRKRVGLDNLLCIYYVIIHASNSVDICAPSLSSDTIVKSLINVKQRRQAKVRIAIYNSVDYSHLRTFSKYGIEVKKISSDIQLEHEFVLINASICADAVAIIGSLDYEVTRVNCKRDTTLITSELAVVSTLKCEFDRLWNSVPEIMKNLYDDNKSKSS
ncbi:mitochondrial cardiolipin hydrolase-like [Epargyreus clarus]|uniref:mitochondrial cardiolipin hydrolase-like n=1 Tax=Epargyreus clarus TaxID=520877 RepID=UPI003C2E6C79